MKIHIPKQERKVKTKSIIRHLLYTKEITTVSLPSTACFVLLVQTMWDPGYCNRSLRRIAKVTAKSRRPTDRPTDRQTDWLTDWKTSRVSVDAFPRQEITTACRCKQLQSLYYITFVTPYFYCSIRQYCLLSMSVCVKRFDRLSLDYIQKASTSASTSQIKAILVRRFSSRLDEWISLRRTLKRR